MVRRAPAPAGKSITVPAGLTATCEVCQVDGRRGRLVTAGTEVAAVVPERRSNGKFQVDTGRLAVRLSCPEDGTLVQFVLPGQQFPT